MMRKLWTVLVVLAMAGLGAGMGVSLAQIRDTSSDLDRAWTEIGVLRGTVDAGNDKLASLGEAPVTVPEVTTEAPGVVTVVRGADGADGADSIIPGPIGVTGLQGLVGSTGASGADGLAGLDGQDGKDGVDGTNGADGVNGADGLTAVGLASLTCQPDGSWLVTLTDGATSTTPGPCRADVNAAPGKPAVP